MNPNIELDQPSGFAVWWTGRCQMSSYPREPPQSCICPVSAAKSFERFRNAPTVSSLSWNFSTAGVFWTQKNGKDWTVEAFLVSEEGGLGLDVAHDASTRSAMLGALAELTTTSVHRLRGKHLEAEDFDKLFSNDPVKDLLLWLSDAEAVRSEWSRGRWAAFRSRCKADFEFDPDKDGELIGAELLGRQQAAWATVWERFTESPVLYRGVPELLRKAKPAGLFEDVSPSWPQNNEKKEAELQQALLALEKSTPVKAREQIIDLESQHGPRREWVWAKLGQAPLAKALRHIARLVEICGKQAGRRIGI